MATMKKSVKKPIKKAQNGTKELPIPHHDLSGRDGVWATGVQISDKDFKKHRKDFEYLDTPKRKPIKKLDPKKPFMPKKPSMKKGGTVKKAFLGSLLGGLATNAIGGALGGMMGGGGGSSTNLQQNNAKLNMPNLGGSMKKGGKVTKAKSGAKFDLNKDGKTTFKDVLIGRGVLSKTAKSGKTIKKAQDGYTLNDGADTLFGQAGAMKKTKVKERSPDGNYVTKRTTRTTPTGKSTKTTTRRTVQGFFNGAPRVGDMVYKADNPSMSQKNGGTTKKAKSGVKMKSGGSMKKCRYGCK